MAPHGNRKAPRPQFLKVLLSDFMTKMPIPTKFVQRHLAHEHGRRATLTSTRGKFWHVDVVRGGDDGGSGEGASFAGEWAEFVKANALAAGDFLVFRYEGNMVFTVKVFDASGCIKEHGDATVALVAGAGAGNAVSVEQTAPRSNPDGILRQSQPTPKSQDDTRNTHKGDKAQKICKRKLSTDDTIRKQSKSHRILIAENENDAGRDDAQAQHNTEAHSNIATEANESEYKDTLPIYVKAVSPCNFRYTYMNIGKKFCSTNGLLTNRLMILKDQEGRSWPVKLTLTADQARMKGGWSHFSSHHGIKVGDRCAFQLVDPHTFRVSIRRAT